MRIDYSRTAIAKARTVSRRTARRIRTAETSAAMFLDLAFAPLAGER